MYGNNEGNGDNNNQGARGVCLPRSDTHLKIDFLAILLFTKITIFTWLWS